MKHIKLTLEQAHFLKTVANQIPAADRVQSKKINDFFIALKPLTTQLNDYIVEAGKQTEELVKKLGDLQEATPKDPEAIKAANAELEKKNEAVNKEINDYADSNSGIVQCEREVLSFISMKLEKFMENQSDENNKNSGFKGETNIRLMTSVFDAFDKATEQ